MALVDYSSDSGVSETESSQNGAHTDGADPQPASKKRKLSPATGGDSLPPLPSAFHDLYAHTVRLSNTDDPSLHQGRKRQIPHIAGNWPSHLYIEWHPQGSEHDILTALLATLSSRLASATASSGNPNEETKIQDFLSSDLGAALPLHISLSRSLSLTTAQKDEFLDELRNGIADSAVGEFELVPTALEWHRTHESSRSFLVLRVTSSSVLSDTGSKAKGDEKNAALNTLLRRCNSVSKSFKQPELYATEQAGESGEGGPGGRRDDAFHVSIAWSFAEPTEELRRATEEVFTNDEFSGKVGAMRIRVDGVKAKIGNVVTHLPLTAAGNRKGGSARARKGLFEV